MVKKSVLTPIIASVLGLAVVGSGVTYFVLNKDSDKKDDKTVSVEKVAQNIDKNVEDAKKAIKGELDFAYDADVTLTLDKSLTNNEEIKPVTFSASTKQKGKKAAADFGISYSGEKVISLNTIIDRESKNGFVKIPELSDSYLKVNGDDLTTQLDALAQSNESLKNLIDQFKNLDTESAAKIDFDTEAFDKSINEYYNAFKDALPEGTEGDKLKGDIDGAAYEYTTKTYEVSVADLTKAAKAVTGKLKADESFKKAYEEFSAKAGATSSNADIPSYDELISELEKELDSAANSEDAKETGKIDIYYGADDKFAGFKIASEDGKEELSLVTVNNEDALGIDFNFNDNTSDKLTLKGAVKVNNDVANGEYNLNFVEDGKDVFSGKVVFKDVKASEDEFTGTIRGEVTADGKTGYGELTADSKKDNSKLTVDFGMDDKLLAKIEFNCKKTEASDVAVPTEKVYNALDQNELQEYAKTIDSNAFVTNIQKALGDELFEKLMGSANTADVGVPQSTDQTIVA